MFQTCSKYVSIELKVGFGGRARPSSIYVSNVLKACLNRARRMFRPCLKFVLTVLEVCFDSDQVSFDRV